MKPKFALGVSWRHDEGYVSLLTILSFRVLTLAVACSAVGVITPLALAQDDTAQLRQAIERQQAVIEQQRRELAEQDSRLTELLTRLEKLEAAQTTEAAEPPAGGAGITRDPVGDMNAEAVQAGEFPGAIRLPRSKISLAIGGFVKGIAFYDSHAERGDEYPLSALLGFAGRDKAGGFGMSAALTRLNMDARAPTLGGQARGYVEIDFKGSSNFQLRHVYLTLATPKGQLLVGQYWGSALDLWAMPETLVDPVVSGPFFARQAQVTWQQTIARKLVYSVAVERPSAGDVIIPEGYRRNTPTPDFVGSLRYGAPNDYHLRVSAIVRRLRFITPDEATVAAAAWGVQVTGGVTTFGSDRLVGGLLTGDGLGRYQLGLDPVSGGFIDPDGRLQTRRSWGGYAAYHRQWNSRLRSNFMGGIADAAPGAPQSAGTFRRSYYAGANLFVRIGEYINFGTAYIYGKRLNKDAPGTDNHRIQLGFQVF